MALYRNYAGKITVDMDCMITIGSKVRVKTPSSDYHNLEGIAVKQYSSERIDNVRFDVAFSQSMLRTAKRPEIVMKAKNTIYFVVTELELIGQTNVTT